MAIMLDGDVGGALEEFVLRELFLGKQFEAFKDGGVYMKFDGDQVFEWHVVIFLHRPFVNGLIAEQG
jgi:hypothetical protein